MITFRAPDDVDDLLAGAEQATGSSRTDLIIAALRLNLSAVVQQIASKRSVLAAEFLRVKPPATAAASPSGYSTSSKKGNSRKKRAKEPASN